MTSTRNKVRKVVRRVKKAVKFAQDPVGTAKEELTEFLTTKRAVGKYSPSMTRLLKKIGKEKVESVQVVRTPLQKFLTTILDLVSLGAYKKAVASSGYDSMFHLALWINNKYSLDKQAVVVLSTTSPIVEDKSETAGVSNIPSGLTISEMIEKTKQFMGDEKFSNYSAKNNNCQDFVLAVLESNRMLNPDLKAFIKQDADKIFEKLPAVSEKIANFATDVGAVADKIVQGGKFEIKKVKHGKFEVVNVDTGKIHAKSTTLKNAKSQVRLLNAIDHGWKPDAKNVSSNKEMTWREFVKKEMAGKKFKSRSEVNAYLKEVARKWKSKKSK